MLERKWAIVWLILSVLTCNISVLFLGKSLKIYSKNGWYNKWYYWTLGIIFGVFPAIVMLFIFVIQTNAKICERFDVSGSDIYMLPYVWIGLLIIPILGWSLFLVLLIYIYLMYIISLFQGKAIRE